MAQIKQVGIGRKSSGTIDGITYYTRNGKTFARSAPTMPASAYNNPDAKVRQAIFKMVQMHMKLHLRTIRQTITAKNGSPSNRYYSLNGKALGLALRTLAEQYVDGEAVTIDDVEQAISTYAAANPKAIIIASKSGYQEVYLTGAWPSTITLYANGGDSTVIIIVSENGTRTTINADGSTTVVSGSTSQDSGGSNNSGTSGTDTGNGGTETPGSSTGSETTTVAAPTFSGATQFTETTQVTMSGPAGASIHYTTDGSDPTSASTVYSAPLTLSATTTVKAIAVKDGVSSSVTSRVYTKVSGGSGDGDDGNQ